MTVLSGPISEVTRTRGFWAEFGIAPEDRGAARGAATAAAHPYGGDGRGRVNRLDGRSQRIARRAPTPTGGARPTRPVRENCLGIIGRWIVHRCGRGASARRGLRPHVAPGLFL